MEGDDAERNAFIDVVLATPRRIIGYDEPSFAVRRRLL
jgi:hypothetical protein